MASLCLEYGIARCTGYHWLRRHEDAGSFSALADRSRAPHEQPHKTPCEVEARVVALRERYG
jgi:hypothetical protein